MSFDPAWSYMIQHIAMFSKSRGLKDIKYHNLSQDQAITSESLWGRFCWIEQILVCLWWFFAHTEIWKQFVNNKILEEQPALAVVLIQGLIWTNNPFSVAIVAQACPSTHINPTSPGGRVQYVQCMPQYLSEFPSKLNGPNFGRLHSEGCLQDSFSRKLHT